MLRSVNSLLGYTVLATDGEIGSVNDMFFDDQTWGTAYLVVRLGHAITRREVLLPPTALGQPDWGKQQFPVAYSKQQVEDSPDIDLDQPISRQREKELFEYFGRTPYWLPLETGLGILPLMQDPVAVDTTSESHHDEGDPHLQSVADVVSYRIRATDGQIGHVEDFIVDDSTWAICYMIVQTTGWLSAHKVLISPELIMDINSEEETVHLNLDTQTVKESPEYDPFEPINHEYEVRLYDYFGRPHGE